MKKIILITGNSEKIAIAKKALCGTGFDVFPKKIDCEEIQADDVSDIAKHSAKFASDALKENVVKIDSGLFIKALNGFPGPYTAYVEKKIDADKILKLMEGETANREAYYKESLAYCEYGKDPVVFESYTHGKIALRLSGDHGWNFDRIFICNGDTGIMANYEDDERIIKYNNENWKNLIKFLLKK